MPRDDLALLASDAIEVLLRLFLADVGELYLLFLLLVGHIFVGLTSDAPYKATLIGVHHLHVLVGHLSGWSRLLWHRRCSRCLARLMLLFKGTAYTIRCLLHDQLLLVGLAAMGQTRGKVDGSLGAA